MTRPELVFISPRFLFPADSGGAIRTTEILRNMRGGDFRIRLLSPAAVGQEQRYSAQLGEIADQWQCWRVSAPGAAASWRRAPLLASRLPLAVASIVRKLESKLSERRLHSGRRWRFSTSCTQPYWGNGRSAFRHCSSRITSKRKLSSVIYNMQSGGQRKQCGAASLQRCAASRAFRSSGSTAQWRFRRATPQDSRRTTVPIGSMSFRPEST